MTLMIDSTDRYLLKVGLYQQQMVAEIEVETAKADQKLLPLIEQLLQQTGITQAQITAIEVAVGPGSFTGTRVGVAVANALSLAWDVPVNGQKGFVQPVYAAEPHITRKQESGFRI